MTDCRKCRSYSRGWCSAAEQTIRHPTAGWCSYYEGPADEDAAYCAGGCGTCVEEDGDLCLLCMPDVDAELSADARREP